MATPTPAFLPAASRTLLRALHESLRLRPSYHPACVCPTQQRRAINKFVIDTKATGVTPFNDPAHPLDEAIPARYVHLVTDDGLQPSQSLSSLLAQLNHKNAQLQQAGKKFKHNGNREYVQQVGQHTSDGAPIVRIRTEGFLRETHTVRAAQQKLQESTQRSNKMIELSWGIVQNDLEHRLKRLEEFLREGRMVDVLIVQKKRGRTAETEEMQRLVDAVRERARGLPGVSELKAMEGAIGKQVTLFFRGSQVGDEGVKLSSAETIRRDRQDKMKRKEEEKAKRREEAEQKKRKAEAREREKLQRLRNVSAKE